MFVDAAQVGCRGGSQAPQAALGQDSLGTPSVRQARASLDQAVAHQSIDQARHAALAEDDLIGQLAHAYPAMRGLGDCQECVVFTE